MHLIRHGQVAGKINYVNCGAFQATRDQGESPNIARVVAPQDATEAVPRVPKTAAPL